MQRKWFRAERVRLPVRRPRSVACWAGVLSGFALLFALPAVAADIPEITSQGFVISQPQGGVLGQFEKIRLRVEAPNRIENLVVSERSYEIDLATTPERAHFDLFGLERRVRQHKDVTLNFANYINRKLDKAGSYRFRVSVTDGDGQTARATLRVEVRDPQPPAKDPAPTAKPVRQEGFEFRRVGERQVSGAEDFALGWKTVDGVNVVIAIDKLDDSEAQFLALTEADFQKIKTKGHLAEAAEKARRVDRLELPAANNEAAGSIFGIEHRDEIVVFKITESSTSLSELGTTVTLVGEVKH